MIVGDMGAAKTCVAQYIANGFNSYGIIVFDPHGMTDWGNAYVISKMGAIYEQMRILLDLLENGDTSPLLIICDEWLEIRGDRRNKKSGDYAGLADDFIRLFSTKPRKFNGIAKVLTLNKWIFVAVRQE
jgi:DNA helicase HerA-like ATPase